MPATDTSETTAATDRTIERGAEGGYDPGANIWESQMADFQAANAAFQECSRAGTEVYGLPRCTFSNHTTLDTTATVIDGLEPNQNKDHEKGQDKTPFKDGHDPLTQEPRRVVDKPSDNKINDLEFSAFANEIAARLKSSPELMKDPDLSKIMQRAADNSQLKSLISAINSSLRAEGSSYFLELSENERTTNGLPEDRPADSGTVYKLDLKDRQNSDNTLASTYITASRSLNRAQQHKS